MPDLPSKATVQAAFRATLITVSRSPWFTPAHLARSGEYYHLDASATWATWPPGVETAQQLQRLSALGCERFQGYFFSRPLAPSVCQQFVLDANLRPLVHAL